VNFIYYLTLAKVIGPSVSVAEIRNKVEKFQQFPKRFVRKGCASGRGRGGVLLAVRRNQRLNWTLSLYLSVCV